MRQYENPMLAFAQQNKEGETREDTTTIAGSDRLSQYCDSLCLWIPKSDEEVRASLEHIEESGDEEANKKFTNAKLLVKLTRNGPCTKYGRYLGFYYDGFDPRVNQQGFCGLVEERTTEMQMVSEKKRDSNNSRRPR